LGQARILERRAVRCNRNSALRALWTPLTRPDFARLEIDDEWVCAIASPHARSESVAIGVPQYPLARLRVPHELAIRELTDRDCTVCPVIDDPHAALDYLDSNGESGSSRELGILPLELIFARFDRDLGPVWRQAGRQTGEDDYGRDDAHSPVRRPVVYLRGFPQAQHRSNCDGFDSTQLSQDHKPCSTAFEYNVRISSSARVRCSSRGSQTSVASSG
jgi:hypothetical protein